VDQSGPPRRLCNVALGEAGPLRKEVRKPLYNEGYSKIEKGDIGCAAGSLKFSAVLVHHRVDW
jgi:hypothetical protein